MLSLPWEEEFRVFLRTSHRAFHAASALDWIEDERIACLIRGLFPFGGRDFRRRYFLRWSLRRKLSPNHAADDATNDEPPHANKKISTRNRNFLLLRLFLRLWFLISSFNCHLVLLQMYVWNWLPISQVSICSYMISPDDTPFLHPAPRGSNIRKRTS